MGEKKKIYSTSRLSKIVGQRTVILKPPGSRKKVKTRKVGKAAFDRDKDDYTLRVLGAPSVCM